MTQAHRGIDKSHSAEQGDRNPESTLLFCMHVCVFVLAVGMHVCIGWVCLCVQYILSMQCPLCVVGQ